MQRVAQVCMGCVCDVVCNLRTTTQGGSNPGPIVLPISPSAAGLCTVCLMQGNKTIISHLNRFLHCTYNASSIAICIYIHMYQRDKNMIRRHFSAQQRVRTNRYFITWNRYWRAILQCCLIYIYIITIYYKPTAPRYKLACISREALYFCPASMNKTPLIYE